MPNRSLCRSHTLVLQTYQIQKAGGFAGSGTPEAKGFTVQRLAAGLIGRRDLIGTARLRSADPVDAYKCTG